jgi:16S rRNA (guanine(966)-N(2))-methyltransferase RsmD
MRIITGTLKGRQIPIPQTDGVRPTSDRTKEGLFSSLIARKDLRGALVLDLFAGSGNLGFEAISRGAARVLFVEANDVCVKSIEQLATKFSITKQCSSLRMSSDAYLARPATQYDVIFADPPYDLEGMPEMIDIVMDNGWLNNNGWFVLEHDKRHDFAEHPYCVFTKAYGRTIVSMFTHSAE